MWVNKHNRLIQKIKQGKDQGLLLDYYLQPGFIPPVFMWLKGSELGDNY